MIKKMILLFLVLSYTQMGCKPKESYCSGFDFEELKLHNEGVSLMLPKYKLTDSLRYGDESDILDYKVITRDSSISLFATVKSYQDRPYAMTSLKRRMESNLEEIINSNPTQNILLKKIIVINKLNVGYIKSLDFKRNEFDSKIFFNKGTKYIVIWILEKADKKLDSSRNNIKSETITDCILEKIKIQ